MASSSFDHSFNMPPRRATASSRSPKAKIASVSTVSLSTVPAKSKKRSRNVTTGGFNETEQGEMEANEGINTPMDEEKRLACEPTAKPPTTVPTTLSTTAQSGISTSEERPKKKTKREANEEKREEEANDAPSDVHGTAAAAEDTVALPFTANQRRFQCDSDSLSLILSFLRSRDYVNAVRVSQQWQSTGLMSSSWPQWRNLQYYLNQNRISWTKMLHHTWPPADPLDLDVNKQKSNRVYHIKADQSIAASHGFKPKPGADRTLAASVYANWRHLNEQFSLAYLPHLTQLEFMLPSDLTFPPFVCSSFGLNAQSFAEKLRVLSYITARGIGPNQPILSPHIFANLQAIVFKGLTKENTPAAGLLTLRQLEYLHVEIPDAFSPVLLRVIRFMSVNHALRYLTLDSTTGMHLYGQNVGRSEQQNDALNVLCAMPCPILPLADIDAAIIPQSKYDEAMKCELELPIFFELTLIGDFKLTEEQSHRLCSIRSVTHLTLPESTLPLGFPFTRAPANVLEMFHCLHYLELTIAFVDNLDIRPLKLCTNLRTLGLNLRGGVHNRQDVGKTYDFEFPVLPQLEELTLCLSGPRVMFDIFHVRTWSFLRRLTCLKRFGLTGSAYRTFSFRILAEQLSQLPHFLRFDLRSDPLSQLSFPGGFFEAVAASSSWRSFHFNRAQSNRTKKTPDTFVESPTGDFKKEMSLEALSSAQLARFRVYRHPPGHFPEVNPPSIDVYRLEYSPEKKPKQQCAWIKVEDE